MQSHQLQSNSNHQKSKRVGRGGKRGTYSGHGSKGQKARAGHRIRPGFRGGDNPIWKIFPKQRGATKKVDIKHRYFAIQRIKPFPINLDRINMLYNDGETVSPKSLVKKGVISSKKQDVKVLSVGQLNKKLNFSGVIFSEAARAKITTGGGVIR